MQLSPNAFALFVLLTFILVAQIHDQPDDQYPAAGADFHGHVQDRPGVGRAVTGVLGVLSCPWLLMANMQAFFGFILYYSALFGPILV